MDGIINLDKPRGLSSFGAVSRVRRLTATRKAGHTGTLDPLASGVLPICLGRATRFSRYLVDGTKVYRAGVLLGATTDSYDAEGEVTDRGDAAAISRDAVETALQAFRGEIMQTPPMHSAVKYQGQRLYRLARQGITVPREARAVTVHRLELTAWASPELTLEIECGKGTYIRSLAHDLGQALGCGAYLLSLARLQVGGLTLENAVSLEMLVDAAGAGTLAALVLPGDSVLGGLVPLVLDEARADLMRHGSRISLTPPEATSGQRYRIYDEDGEFLGVARLESADCLKPERVYQPFPPGTSAVPPQV